MSRSIQLIYVEEGVRDHPRTRSVLERFPAASRLSIERYGEVFNRKAQSLVSYGRSRERRMIEFCAAELTRRVPADRLFACEPQRGDAPSP